MDGLRMSGFDELKMSGLHGARMDFSDAVRESSASRFGGIAFEALTMLL